MTARSASAASSRRARLQLVACRVIIYRTSVNFIIFCVLFLSGVGTGALDALLINFGPGITRPASQNFSTETNENASVFYVDKLKEMKQKEVPAPSAASAS